MKLRPSFPAPFILAICVIVLFGTVHPQQAEESRAKISRIEFKDTPLSDAVAFLRIKSAELHPAGKEINFIIDPEIDLEQPITLRLNDVSVGIAAIYMIDHANLDYRIDAHGCFILPGGQGELAKRRPLESAATAQYGPAKKARQVVLDKIEFDEASIESVLNYIAEKSATELKGAGGINVVLNQRVDPEIPVTLQLTDVPISYLLTKISEATALEIRIEAHAIFFDPPGAKALRWASLPKEVRKKQRRLPSVHKSSLWTAPKDPRKKGHPDYHYELNGVYKWVGRRWTFIRPGSGDLRPSSLDSLRKLKPATLQPPK